MAIDSLSLTLNQQRQFLSAITSSLIHFAREEKLEIHQIFRNSMESKESLENAVINERLHSSPVAQPYRKVMQVDEFKILKDLSGHLQTVFFLFEVKGTLTPQRWMERILLKLHREGKIRSAHIEGERVKILGLDDVTLLQHYFNLHHNKEITSAVYSKYVLDHYPQEETSQPSAQTLVRSRFIEVVKQVQSICSQIPELGELECFPSDENVLDKLTLLTTTQHPTPIEMGISSHSTSCSSEDKNSGVSSSSSSSKVASSRLAALRKSASRYQTDTYDEDKINASMIPLTIETLHMSAEGMHRILLKENQLKNIFSEHLGVIVEILKLIMKNKNDDLELNPDQIDAPQESRKTRKKQVEALITKLTMVYSLEEQSNLLELIKAVIFNYMDTGDPSQSKNKAKHSNKQRQLSSLYWEHIEKLELKENKKITKPDKNRIPVPEELRKQVQIVETDLAREYLEYDQDPYFLYQVNGTLSDDRTLEMNLRARLAQGAEITKVERDAIRNTLKSMNDYEIFEMQLGFKGEPNRSTKGIYATNVITFFNNFIKELKQQHSISGDAKVTACIPENEIRKIPQKNLHVFALSAALQLFADLQIATEYLNKLFKIDSVKENLVAKNREASPKHTQPDQLLKKLKILLMKGKLKTTKPKEPLKKRPDSHRNRPTLAKLAAPILAASNEGSNTVIAIPKPTHFRSNSNEHSASHMSRSLLVASTDSPKTLATHPQISTEELLKLNDQLEHLRETASCDDIEALPHEQQFNKQVLAIAEVIRKLCAD